MKKELARFILLFQGIYYSVAALWPFVYMLSAEVTYPKTDIWFVYVISTLLLSEAVYFLFALKYKLSDHVKFLSLISALILVFIDFYFMGIGVASDIYLLDAIIQVMIILEWFVSIIKLPGSRTSAMGN